MLRDRINRIISPYIKECIKENMNSLSKRSQPIYLGNNLMACQMVWGGWVVVPTFNIDVAIGAIRDGIIENATTQFIIENLHYENRYINVGANFGYYTSLAGNIVGNKGFIYSYEANPVVFAILLRTIFYAGIIDRVKVFNRAVSNSCGETFEMFFDYQFIGGGTVFIDDFNTPPIFKGDLIWNSTNIKDMLHEDGSYWVGKGLHDKIEVQTTTLDSTVTHDKIDMIHCDAEGSEPYILLGAKRIISQSENIKLVFEWGSFAYQHRGEEYRKIVRIFWDFLRDEGFTVRKISSSLNNGKTSLSEPMTFDVMTQSAEHGDYYACRE